MPIPFNSNAAKKAAGSSVNHRGKKVVFGTGGGHSFGNEERFKTIKGDSKERNTKVVKQLLNQFPDIDKVYSCKKWT